MRALALLLLMATPVSAETLVAARAIRAQTILTEADLSVIAEAVPGMLAAPEQAVGLEARTMLYAGRPIRPEDVGPPAVVERNALVTLVFIRRGLTITAEGRALGRGGAGDAIRVINLASRTTITGTVAPDGRVIVGPFSGS